MSEPRSNTQPAGGGTTSTNLARLRHDLRTPINQILGYCEMLMEDGTFPASFTQDLKRIHSGGKQLQALIVQYFQDETYSSNRNLHQLYHELRTPVNHVIGYSELLSEQAVEQGLNSAAADLGKIREAASTWLELMEAYLVQPDGAGDLTPQTAVAGAAPSSALFQVGLGFQVPEPDAARAGFADEGAILVVDDDDANRDMLTRRLRRHGYTVSTAPNGLRALHLARAQKFDLVLLDMIMPGLDGFQVLARFKNEAALKHIPIIMLSALDQENGIARCIELGAEDYVAKPFNPVFLRARIGAAMEKKRLRDREVSYLKMIEDEKRRSDDLLHIILPQEVAAELKARKVVQPRRFENAGVLFCDVVGFTAYCNEHPPEEVVKRLQAVVDACEQLAQKYGLEKIKTIGDSFMAVGGLRTVITSPAETCIRCGLEMIQTVERIPPHWQVRVGVSAGPVIAGVIGNRKYQYDVWGDTVNLAARMEAASSPGSVCVTAELWRSLGNLPFQHDFIGQMNVKGKGVMDLVRISPETKTSPPTS